MSKQHEEKLHALESALTGESQTSVLRSLRSSTADETLLRGVSRYEELEEVLIVDRRANLGPAELVENKLSNLLNGGLLPISQLRMKSLGGRRHPCCG